MSGPESTSNAGYTIGYGKPPKSSQFKKGHSGNPSGGNAKRKSLHDQLLDELAETVSVKTATGKVIQITKQEMVIKQLIKDAMNGDTRAVALALKIVSETKVGGDEGVDGVITEAVLKQLCMLVEPPDAS